MSDFAIGRGDSLRVAVVGMGKMGIVHSSVLHVIPGVEVVGLCEKSRLIRRFLKKVFTDVEIVDDVEKLTGMGLNAVYVTTPIPSHYPITKAIYAKNVAQNVFVEKTLANNYDESIELCGLASRCGGVNMVGYLRRFYVTFKKAKEMLAQGALGELSSFSVHALSSDFLGMKEEDSASSMRGGVLRDLGCHALDLALWYFGDLKVEPANVNSVSPCSAKGMLEFQGSSSAGLTGDFRISWCQEGYRMPEVGVTIVGSEGKLQVNDDLVRFGPKRGHESIWYRHDLSDNVPFWLGLPEYYREDLHFVETVKSGAKIEPDFVSASKVDRMIAEVERLGD